MSDSPSRASSGWSWLRRPWVILVAAVVIALVVGFGGGLLGSQIGQSTAGQAGGRPGSCDAARIADEVLPTIVTINVRGASASGVGSGEIVSKDGYIVTNNHVISAAADGGAIDVRFSSGEQTSAKLVGRDPKSDLAVLKVDGSSSLPMIAWGDSEKISVGQPVVALGAPLGLSSTVTAGIVSALGRNVPVPSDNDTTTTLAGAIQTDASINPGNSGGALVNCSGQLIGVNTAIATVPNAVGQAGGGSVGIGFAVPVNLAHTIVTQLIETGTVAYPYFGVEITPIPHAVAERFGIEDGLFIQSVVAGGPADKAGLRAGDVVTQIDGQSANNADVITRVTLTKKAGDTITVKYLRDGHANTVTVTLGAIP